MIYIVLVRKYFFSHRKATWTSAINTGTSTNGPMTAAKAAPLLIPKTAMATAIASSKLLLAAVKESDAVTGYDAPAFFDAKKEIAEVQ